MFRAAAEALAKPFDGAGATHVVGVEARGFWFGTSLAERLRAGFVPARKPGKLPGDVLREAYALEYGTDALELQADVLGPDARVLVHDDVVATGGTAAAAARLVARAGAEVVGFSFLVELTSLGGRERLPGGVPVHVVLGV